MTFFCDTILFIACLFILAGSIYISCKTRFIQIRCLPTLFQMLKAQQNKTQADAHTISPHKALFTAMSTTLGISTIVGPVIAIHFGGPGALFGFLFTAFFGSAATFLEVQLCMQHRRKLASGAILGGAMPYLEYLFSPRAAKWYALSCLLLMTAWSGAQANQLAAVLHSPLLGPFQIPVYLSAAVIAGFIFLTLLGGIQRISTFSAKLVPTMFLLYLGSCLWVLICNASQIGPIFSEIFHAMFEPHAMGSGVIVGGIVASLRWGIFKGTQACEAGIGTQTIPHSMAETQNPEGQAALAMLSTYTAGFVAFLSGCVALITKTWQDPTLPLGISMVARSFQLYFSHFGIAIVAISALLFGFGTILGNSYNGSQCFSYLSRGRNVRLYLLAVTGMTFLGAIAEVKTFWALSDLVLAAMALPHMAALALYASRLSQQKSIAISPGT